MKTARLLLLLAVCSTTAAFAQPRPQLLNGSYERSVSTTEYYTLALDQSGNINFSTAGARVSLYTADLTPIELNLEGNINRFLDADTYVVQFDFWSRNSKRIGVYSPLLPPPLEPLSNGSYERSVSTTEYYTLALDQSGNINFSTAGARVSLYTADLTPIELNLEGNINRFLDADTYVVQFDFWSSNSKRIGVYSPLIASCREPLSNGSYERSVSTTEYYTLALDQSGNINFSTAGARVSLYTADLTPIELNLEGNINRFLDADTYVVQFDFWSSNSKRIGVYSSGIKNTPLAAPLVAGSTPTSDTRPTWTWTACGNHGNGTFRYRFNDSDLTSGATVTTATTFTARAQTAGIYTLYVQERDEVGNWSTSGSKQISIISPPNLPVILAVESGDGELLVRSSVPYSGGSTISSYTATCTDGTTQYTGTSSTSRITVSGLTNGVGYSCSVTATNAAGTSTASATSPPIVPEYIPVGLPIWLLYEASK